LPEDPDNPDIPDCPDCPDIPDIPEGKIISGEIILPRAEKFVPLQSDLVGLHFFYQCNSLGL